MLPFLPPFPPHRLSPRTKFTELEDLKLRNLVEAMPFVNWKVIGGLMGNRSPRQCRERYKNYLAPSVRMEPWTAEEDALLLEKHREIGPKWAQMTHFFNNRTAVGLKNRHVRITQHFSGDARSDDHAPSPRENSEEALPPPPQLPRAVVSIFQRTERAGDAWFSQEPDPKFGSVV
jgi:hypothetical protein